MSALNIPRVLVVSLLLSLLAGCKLALIVVEGGKVDLPNLNPAYADCEPTVPGTVGNVCIIEVTTHDFTENFTAVPDPGWRFVRWNSGTDFICGGSTNPVCPVSNVGTQGNPTLEALVASDATFYLMPVFVEGEFITDTVIVGDNEWAQPSHFTNLTWTEINRVCPAGNCDGILNGYDMTGWRWAALVHIVDLFNHYIGSPAVGLPGFYLETNSIWAPIFLSDFDPTSTTTTGESAWGWSGSVELPSEFPYVAQIHQSYSAYSEDAAEAMQTLGHSYSSPALGAWFFRPAP